MYFFLETKYGLQWSSCSHSFSGSKTTYFPPTANKYLDQTTLIIVVNVLISTGNRVIHLQNGSNWSLGKSCAWHLAKAYFTNILVFIYQHTLPSMTQWKACGCEGWNPRGHMNTFMHASTFDCFLFTNCSAKCISFLFKFPQVQRSSLAFTHESGLEGKIERRVILVIHREQFLFETILGQIPRWLSGHFIIIKSWMAGLTSVCCFCYCCFPLPKLADQCDGTANFAQWPGVHISKLGNTIVESIRIVWSELVRMNNSKHLTVERIRKVSPINVKSDHSWWAEQENRQPWVNSALEEKTIRKLMSLPEWDLLQFYPQSRAQHGSDKKKKEKLWRLEFLSIASFCTILESGGRGTCISLPNRLSYCLETHTQNIRRSIHLWGWAFLIARPPLPSRFDDLV